MIDAQERQYRYVSINKINWRRGVKGVMNLKRGRKGERERKWRD